ncbi:hypothetical protein PSTT_06926 [Puccinia striiformis]|nr:hypothetical protein PSTT_06926 [Puccinia striiformis]
MNKIFDPLPDGNCGFCCIARALGYKVEGWFQVSGRGHREAGAYTKLQGGEEQMKTILQNLKVKSKKATCIGVDEF